MRDNNNQNKMVCVNSRKSIFVLVGTSGILTLLIIYDTFSEDIQNQFSHEQIHPLTNLKGACLSNCQKCGYSMSFPGGYGAKIHDMLFAWSWAIQNNITYKGVVVGSDRKVQTLNALFQLLKLPFNIQQRPFQNCSLLSNYKADHWIQDNPFLNRLPKKVGTKRKIVVHVRRGDVGNAYHQTGDYYRYMPNVYFLNLIEKIAQPNDHVIILSQRTESFEEFIQAGYDVRLDTSEVEAWRTIIDADVFIMSRSSFSYVPALFATGTVYYDEFWTKPLRHWIVTNLTENSTIQRTNNTHMAETTFPCSGGEFGAKTIQTYVCVISKTNVPIAHMPHWAQVVFPCWSWFSEKKAKNCAFLVKDGLKNSWFDFIALKMGCQTLRTPPGHCAVVGIFDTGPGVGPGDSYSWITSQYDAAKLQHNIFRQKMERKDIGILERKVNRRINADKMNISSDVIFFEKMSFYNQCKWMHEHKIIIAAHGAAMTHAICVQKCTVIIQLYPEHYYPNRFFEPLIRESGGIPISWIKNKYLGSNETEARENEAMLQEDFKRENKYRSHWKTQNINIDHKSLKILLQRAKTEQKQCESKQK